MATFAVRMIHGPNWDPARGVRKQDDWDAHAEFMDGLVDRGLILVGGPIGGGALHLVEATDEATIRAQLREDPWARSGQLEVGSIEPWPIWLDGRGVTSRV